MKSKILLPLIALGIGQSLNAATIIFSETFSTATVSGSTITADAGHSWFASFHGNPAPPVGSAGVGDDGGNRYGVLNSEFLPKAGDWRGAQIRVTDALPSAQMTAYALGDIKVSLRIAVTATSLPAGGTMNIQLRQAGQANQNGTTHTYNYTITNIAGAWQTIEFDLDEAIVGTFTAFNANPVSIFVEVNNTMEATGSNNSVSVRIDDFIVTAVPEPSSALIGFAAFPLLLKRRRILPVRP